MTNVVDVATNTVAAVASQAATQVTNSLGQQADEGRRVLVQCLDWLTKHGVDFAVNVLAALAILFLGGLVVKLIVAALRKALEQNAAEKPQTGNAPEFVESFN